MKKFIVICVSVIVCISLLIITENISTRKECREKYFSNEQEFIEIKDILINHYEKNNISTELSYWSNGESISIFERQNEDKIISTKVDNKEMTFPLTNEAIDKINQLLSNSYYECVDVDSNFVEFGNTAGSFTIWYSRTDKKPQTLGKQYSLVNMGNGWYFSRSTAR